MIYEVRALCWECYEGALPVERTIYISGMPVNLDEKIKVGFFLRKKETNYKYIYYLIKKVARLYPEEEEALSGICDINIYMNLTYF